MTLRTAFESPDAADGDTGWGGGGTVRLPNSLLVTGDRGNCPDALEVTSP